MREGTHTYLSNFFHLLFKFLNCTQYLLCIRKYFVNSLSILPKISFLLTKQQATTYAHKHMYIHTDIQMHAAKVTQTHIRLERMRNTLNLRI